MILIILIALFDFFHLKHLSYWLIIFPRPYLTTLFEKWIKYWTIHHWQHYWKCYDVKRQKKLIAWSSFCGCRTKTGAFYRNFYANDVELCLFWMFIDFLAINVHLIVIHLRFTWIPSKRAFHEFYEYFIILSYMHLRPSLRETLLVH